jgi:hypothetical protein
MIARTEQEGRNIALLESRGIDHGWLRPTQNGLDKHILDATIPLRRFLADTGVHDFSLQELGPEHKVLVPAFLIHHNGQLVESSASLYQTKRGDRRVWITNLPAIAAAGDLVLCIRRGEVLGLANASRQDLHPSLVGWEEAVSSEDPMEPAPADPSAFEELFAKLQAVSKKGYIPAPVEGSTSVGRLLETELGIQMNPSKDPDYHGIEIKSARSGSRRATMFAQVPDWSRSAYAGSAQLLAAFGSEKPGGRALSCTVSAREANTQDLYLQIDRDADLLRVRQDELNPREVVLWELAQLRDRLAAKHAESVWVEAAVERIRNREHFWFHTARHTRQPRPEELVRLVRKGKVTVDFLIREGGDRGYLFKIVLDELSSLFAYSKAYRLG